MDKLFFTLGSVFGATGVMLGAFAAHGLRARLEPDLLAVFETGARYQVFHALALLGVAWAANRWPGGATTLAGWALAAGVVVFSGSLYALALTGIRGLGAITPIGGVALIVGWIALALAPWFGRS